MSKTADRIRNQVVVNNQESKERIHNVQNEFNSLKLELNKEKEKIVELKKENSYLKQNSIDENIPNHLEEIEDQLFQLKDGLDRGAWLIGQRLAHIRTHSLYKEGFTTFEDYCHQKFDFSRVTAWRFIYYFENYDQVTALKHGSKLLLLKGLDDKNHSEILTDMDKKQYTFRELQDRVKELKNRQNGQKVAAKKKNEGIDVNDFVLFEDGEEEMTIKMSGLKNHRDLLAKIKRMLVEYIK